MLKIVLKKPKGKGYEEKIYTNSFISARMYRRTLEISKKLNEELNPDLLDEFMDYVCEMFNHQFTIDELYDGLAGHDLIKSILGVVDQVASSVLGGNTTQEKEAKDEPEKK